MKLSELSVITITYNNPKELMMTHKSLESFRKDGGHHIVINGGSSVADIVNDCSLVEEADEGIYDALNKGIKHVDTSYFMLIHSGDSLIADVEILKGLLGCMEDSSLDLMLNNCSIEFGNWKRIMKSDNWKPWMFLLGAQPPHPPIIYRTEAVKRFSYDLKHPVSADFKYLEELFKQKLKYGYGREFLIHMSGGGATSSGIKSFFYVNRQFRLLKGPLRMVIFAVFRPFIKIYQML